MPGPVTTPPPAETGDLGAHFGDALDAVFAAEDAPAARADTPAAAATDPLANADPDLSLEHSIAQAIDAPAKTTKEVAVKTTAPKIPSAVKKTVAPVKEVSATSSDEAPAGLDEKAGAKWKEIRQETKAAKDRAEAAEARAAELETKLKAFNPDEIEGLRKRTAEQEADLSVVRVEATREFQNSIVEPTKRILEAAKLIAGRYEIPEAQMLAALRETDPEKQSVLLEALGGTLSSRDQSRLFAMGDDILRIEDRKKLILTNAKESLDRITGRQQQQLQAATEEQKAAYTGALDEVLDALRSKSDFFSTEGDDVDPDHKKAVSAAIDVARSVDFDTLDPRGKAFAAYAGAHFPYLMGVIGALQARTEELEGQLGGFKSSTPGAGAGLDAHTGGAGDDPDASFLESIEKRIG